MLKSTEVPSTKNSYKHSLAVANKMVELNNGKNNEEIFLIGYLHDIG